MALWLVGGEEKIVKRPAHDWTATTAAFVDCGTLRGAGEKPRCRGRTFGAAKMVEKEIK